MYSVYKHTCPNGKVYIGITSKSPKERWGHRYKNNIHFTRAINKYGWENIKHEILYTGMTKEEAEQKEIELIAMHKSNQQEYGYNIAKGGHSNSGYRHSDETKMKIRNSLKGEKHTLERRMNQSKAQKKLWSDENHKEKMRKAHLGKQQGKDHPMSKTVYQYSLSKELLNIFESTGCAERITGIDHRQISDCCNHKQESCHGYIWSYEIL